MNKTAIHNFAVNARRKLMTDIEYRCGLLGITVKDIAEPSVKEKGMESYAIAGGVLNTLYGKDIENRNKIVMLVMQKGFTQFIEETAYTWFNRIIAIRFMEVNNYLPTRTRVLSSETPGKTEPDLVTEGLQVDLGFTEKQLDYIAACKRDNKADELYRFLFLRQCNKLGEILPELFEHMDDYTELLFGLSYIDPNGVLRELIEIPEEDFDIGRGGQVEIIGWLYQYYNTELKNETFSIIQKEKRITKDRIPAATQLFTPDWIVRYMVENSLGRLWVEGHPNDELKTGWKYYLEEAEQEPNVQAQLAQIRRENFDINPEEIKFIDPCMGSGHILVYAFNVLMEIYESCGYTQRDAARLIVEKNLYGLDIDDRAYQLAYFAVMMKARQYDRLFLSRSVEPNLCAIQESNEINPDYLELFESLEPTANRLVTLFHDAKEYGSILNVDLTAAELKALKERLDSILSTAYGNIFDSIRQIDLNNLFEPLLKQATILQQKYDVVVTNPPYMASSNMNRRLSDYVKINYSSGKADLFAVFISKCANLSKTNLYYSLVTMQSWMFLSSLENIRNMILNNSDIVNLAQIGYNSFPELNSKIVQTVVFVLRNKKHSNYMGKYFDLTNNYAQNADKELVFLSEKGKGFERKSELFAVIPGAPIAYWVNENFLQTFRNQKIGDCAEVITGMTTGNNERFLRLWFEIEIQKAAIGYSNMKDINFSIMHWIPYSKGGNRRNWAGNYDYLVNWKQKDSFNRSKTTLQHLYLKEAITWPFITSGRFSARYLPQGFLWDVIGSPCFFNDKDTLLYTLGYLCSNVADMTLHLINPTIAVQAVDLSKLPLLVDSRYEQTVIECVKQNLTISQNEWDSFETSWGFSSHPLICGKTIKDAFSIWESKCNTWFNQIKTNEVRLNNIFIDIYGLSDELTPDVADDAVTVRKVDLSRDIRSFISYAVGCILGRYSLDKDGLVYAGGKWDDSNYKKFLPDVDNILPITDEEYFSDDIVDRFIEFVSIVYEDGTLEENLAFISSALSGKGNSREIIRNYFLNDFFKDHCGKYSVTGSGKRPIYWLFDSGKKNGFKALIYMHRYDRDTVARVRTDYLHRIQAAYESAITMCDNTIAGNASASDKARAVKRKEKIVKQLAETRLYDQAIAHIAAQRIEINLDDGVKHNYELFQGVKVASTGKKAQKIDLLAPIK